MMNIMITLTQMEFIRQDDEYQLIFLAHMSCIFTDNAKLGGKEERDSNNKFDTFFYIINLL